MYALAFLCSTVDLVCVHDCKVAGMCVSCWEKCPATVGLGCVVRVCACTTQICCKEVTCTPYTAIPHSSKM